MKKTAKQKKVSGDEVEGVTDVGEGDGGGSLY